MAPESLPHGTNPFMSGSIDPGSSQPAIMAPEEMPDIDDLEDTLQSEAPPSTRRRLMGFGNDDIHGNLDTICE